MDYDYINNLCKAYYDEKQFDKAVEVLDVPNLPEHFVPNLAKCLFFNNQAERALSLLLPLEKTTDIWLDLCVYYNALGKYDEAFKAVQNIKDGDARAEFNRGFHYLRYNEFKKGFKCLDSGRQIGCYGGKCDVSEGGTIPSSKKWNGQRVKELVLLCEGGLGDNLIFLRWAEYLKTKCDRLIVACDRGFMRLLSNAGFDVIPSDSVENFDFDYYTPCMSLPLVIDVNHPTDKVTFPYINSLVEPYLTKLIDSASQGRKKIGIKWAGNPRFEHEQFRTVPGHLLKELDQYGQCFSFQFEDEDDSLPNLRNLIKDWQDTYSILKSLDVVVTSCTSIAHLAGIVGVKTFVLVPLASYFVWASDTEKWYPENVEVIKQTEYGDWTGAIEILHKKMQEL